VAQLVLEKAVVVFAAVAAAAKCYKYPVFKFFL